MKEKIIFNFPSPLSLDEVYDKWKQWAIIFILSSPFWFYRHLVRHDMVRFLHETSSKNDSSNFDWSLIVSFLIWFKSWYVRTCYVLTVPNLLETSSCFLEQFLTETKTCRDWKAFIPLAIFLSDILSENKTDHRTTLIRPIFYGGMQNMLDILSSSDQRISSLNALYPRSYFCLVDTNSSTTHAVEFY